MSCFISSNLAVPHHSFSLLLVRWQVPWGKHTPVKDEDYRQHHKTDHDSKVDPNAIFPAVTVRDPAAWMASMCRHEYAMDWPHGVGHCPNLVATSADVALDSTLTESTNIPISITYADFVQPHDSLIHHWNEWNNAYKEAPFPRVLVRFEDVSSITARTESIRICTA